MCTRARTRAYLFRVYVCARLVRVYTNWNRDFHLTTNAKHPIFIVVGTSFDSFCSFIFLFFFLLHLEFMNRLELNTHAKWLYVCIGKATTAKKCNLNMIKRFWMFIFSVLFWIRVWFVSLPPSSFTMGVCNRSKEKLIEVEKTEEMCCVYFLKWKLRVLFCRRCFFFFFFFFDPGRNPSIQCKWYKTKKADK